MVKNIIKLALCAGLIIFFGASHDTLSMFTQGMRTIGRSAGKFPKVPQPKPVPPGQSFPVPAKKPSSVSSSAAPSPVGVKKPLISTKNIPPGLDTPHFQFPSEGSPVWAKPVQISSNTTAFDEGNSLLQAIKATSTIDINDPNYEKQTEENLLKAINTLQDQGFTIFLVPKNSASFLSKNQLIPQEQAQWFTQEVSGKVYAASIMLDNGNVIMLTRSGIGGLYGIADPNIKTKADYLHNFYMPETIENIKFRTSTQLLADTLIDSYQYTQKQEQEKFLSEPIASESKLDIIEPKSEPAKISPVPAKQPVESAADQSSPKEIKDVVKIHIPPSETSEPNLEAKARAQELEQARLDAQLALESALEQTQKLAGKIADFEPVETAPAKPVEQLQQKTSQEDIEEPNLEAKARAQELEQTQLNAQLALESALEQTQKLAGKIADVEPAETAPAKPVEQLQQKTSQEDIEEPNLEAKARAQELEQARLDAQRALESALEQTQKLAGKIADVESAETAPAKPVEQLQQKASQEDIEEPNLEAKARAKELEQAQLNAQLALESALEQTQKLAGKIADVEPAETAPAKPVEQLQQKTSQEDIEEPNLEAKARAKELDAAKKVADKNAELELINKDATKAQTALEKAKKETELKELEKLMQELQQQLEAEQKQLSEQEKEALLLKQEQDKKELEAQQAALNQELAEKKEAELKAEQAAQQEIAKQKAAQEAAKKARENELQAKKDLEAAREEQNRQEQLRKEAEKRERDKEEENRKKLEEKKEIDAPGGGDDQLPDDDEKQQEKLEQEEQPILQLTEKQPLPKTKVEPILIPPRLISPVLSEEVRPTTLSNPVNKTKASHPSALQVPAILLEEPTPLQTPPKKITERALETTQYSESQTQSIKPAVFSPAEPQGLGGPVDREPIRLTPSDPTPFPTPKIPTFTPRIQHGGASSSSRPSRASYGGISSSGSSDSPAFEQQPVLLETKVPQPQQIATKKRKLSPKAIEIFEKRRQPVQSDQIEPHIAGGKKTGGWLRGLRLLQKKHALTTKKTKIPTEKAETIDKKEKPKQFVSFVQRVTHTITQSITAVIDTIGSYINQLFFGT